MPRADRFSWFRFNAGDFISDPAVQSMDDATLGKFMRILVSLYLENVSVADEDLVRSWARCSESDGPRYRGPLARAFKVRRDGKWLQKRVALELRHAKKHVQEARKKGAAGARKRWSSKPALSLEHS